MGIWWPRKKKLSLAEKIGTGVVLAAGLFQIVQSALYYRPWEKPSPERAAFEQTYGARIHGYPSDIESRLHLISDIADVMARERIEKPFGAGSINIISTNPFKRDLLDNVLRLRKPDLPMYCTPGLGTMNICADALKKENFFSLVKKLKLEEVVLNDSTIRDEWMPLNPVPPDDPGIQPPEINPKILRVGYQASPFQQSGFLNAVQSGGDPKELDSQIAGFAGMIEGYSESPAQLYLRILNPLQTTPPTPNEVDLNNVRVLQRHGLLPEEFLLHIYLAKYAYNALKTPDLEWSYKYLSSSSKILEAYPRSIYRANIRLTRARVLEKLGEANNDDYSAARVEEELKLALKAEYKEKNTHQDILSALQRYYAGRGETENANTLTQAGQLFLKKYWAGDPTIATSGVNEYLASKGIL